MNTLHEALGYYLAVLLIVVSQHLTGKTKRINVKIQDNSNVCQSINETEIHFIM
jgi:hypothetical protein